MMDPDRYNELLENWENLTDEEYEELRAEFNRREQERANHPDQYVTLVHHVSVPVRVEHAAIITGVDWNSDE